MAYDDVFDMIGSCGRYQKFIYVLQTLPVVFTAIQTYLSVFILYVPEYRCAGPNINASRLKIEGVNLNLSHLNSAMMYPKCTKISTEFIYQMLEAMAENNNQHNVYTNKFLHTNYISLEASVDDNSTEDSSECKRWTYDTSKFDTTFVTETNLVCSKKLYRTHAIVIYMAGFTLESLLFGSFSDRFGRKLAFVTGIVLYIVPNIALSFVHEFWIFTLLRFISGISVGGLLSTCYVMDLELIGPRKRILAGMVYMLFWGFGALLLTGMAYLIRDWRNLNLILALPTIFLLFYICCVPESTRWLVVKGKREEAEKKFKKIAKRNNRTIQEPILPEEDVEDDGEAQLDGQRVSIIDICSYPRLMCNTIVIFFNWFVVALVFLGLSWNVNYQEGDVFLNFFLTCIAEIGGFLLCIPLLNRVGRKPVYIVSLLTGGFSLLFTIFPVISGSSDKNWVILLLSLVGKVDTSAAFATIFLFSAEIFPTVIRNSGLGIGNLCARIGGMLAPYIPDLSQIVSGDMGKVLPMCIFGGLGILAGLLSLLIPETNKRKLPDTLEDAVDFVQPPMSSPIQQGQEMEPTNGQLQQSEESDMLQPLNEQRENPGDVIM